MKKHIKKYTLNTCLLTVLLLSTVTKPAAQTPEEVKIHFEDTTNSYEENINKEIISAQKQAQETTSQEDSKLLEDKANNLTTSLDSYLKAKTNFLEAKNKNDTTAQNNAVEVGQKITATIEDQLQQIKQAILSEEGSLPVVTEKPSTGANVESSGSGDQPKDTSNTSENTANIPSVDAEEIARREKIIKERQAKEAKRKAQLEKSKLNTIKIIADRLTKEAIEANKLAEEAENFLKLHPDTGQDKAQIIQNDIDYIRSFAKTLTSLTETLTTNVSKVVKPNVPQQPEAMQLESVEFSEISKVEEAMSELILDLKAQLLSTTVQTGQNQPVTSKTIIIE